ncbi:PQ-loop-domain-containing protein [Leucogyrophana mollusca]|uniref:PQ-loop-domain-containing protein n=1 Tax=Leucogyrophana mollusca TaxID=85980 RepID=A0ACB8AZU8_9AGAM|nr:PQ-loop-domain-containing protein [Leucogyrophana mollusca]
MIAESDVASSVLGWVSIACWIIVYSPQIIENYQLQSGEGLSLLFVYVWLLGDLCNLGGAVLAGLLPTVIILGVYYTLCDTTLLFQVYYYRWRNQAVIRRSQESPVAIPDEETRLLGQDAVSNTIERPSITRIFLQYLAAVMFVAGTGVAAYFISDWLDDGSPSSLQSGEGTEWSIQIIGWTSAVLYLGSRIPQILKNTKTRCEGLAPGLFLFAIMGNTTYALSICVASMERNYLIRNASWLAGSALTVFFDLIVLGQFFYYGYISRQRGWIDGADS